jgi:hypothetical protein
LAGWANIRTLHNHSRVVLGCWQQSPLAAI